MDINTTPPILPIFFHVCCRWKILTVYHVIMFLLLKLVDTWTFQERKMVTKTCASLKKMKCVTSFTIRVWKNCQNILFIYELNALLKNMFFSYSKIWWLQIKWSPFFNWAHGFAIILHSWMVPVSTGFYNRNINKW